MDIRRLTPFDLKDYKAIRLEALSTEPTAFSADFQEELVQDDAFHLTRIQVGPLYGAYEGDRIIGMTGVILFREENLRHKAAIWGVYVSPAHRGAGVARALMGRALDDLPEGRSHIILGVEENNGAALALYQALGFEEYGREPAAFVKDGVAHTEILMRWSR